MPGPVGSNNSHLSNTQVNETAIEINAAPGSNVNVEVVNNNVSNQTQSPYPEQDCCCCDGSPQPAPEGPETGGPFGAPVRGVGSQGLFGAGPAHATGSHGDAPAGPGQDSGSRALFGAKPSYGSGTYGDVGANTSPGPGNQVTWGAGPGHGTGSHGDSGVKPGHGIKPGHEIGGYGQGERREPAGTNQEIAHPRGWLSQAGRTTGLQRLLDYLGARGWLRRTRH